MITEFDQNEDKRDYLCDFNNSRSNSELRLDILNADRGQSKVEMVQSNSLLDKLLLKTKKETVSCVEEGIKVFHSGGYQSIEVLSLENGRVRDFTSIQNGSKDQFIIFVMPNGRATYFSSGRYQADERFNLNFGKITGMCRKI